MSAEDLLLIAINATGAQPLVRDYGLQESAAARLRTNLFGTDAYQDIGAKAAALGHSLIRNKPLPDGNKRLGWVAMRTSLELNDVPARSPNDSASSRLEPFGASPAVRLSELRHAALGHAQPVDQPAGWLREGREGVRWTGTPLTAVPAYME